MAKTGPGRLSKSERESYKQDFKDLSSSLKSLAKDSGAFSKIWDNMFDITEQSMAALVKSNDLSKDGVKIKKKDLIEHQKSLAAIKQVVGQVDDLTKGLGESVAKVKGFKDMLTSATLGPAVKIVAIVTALATAFIKVRKLVADTRKDLGVSALESLKVVGAFKVLEFSGKAFGLEAEDFKESFKAAREDLGASVDESLKLSFNLAKTAMETGTTASELTKVLSVMESVSGASREALLSQIEMNRQIIGDAGLSPADIFGDIAENAEFFAQFAKDGSQNLIQAGIAAKKLGLNMSAVAGITESLLDIESSIEKQLEASMLLGRQINLDRARQLALTGDQEGMMGEILKQVGGEAEFNKMNVLQRKALAESVGVNVEQLSRLVRNNTAGAPGAAMGAAAAGGKDAYPLWVSMDRKLGKIDQGMTTRS
jgi:plasmid maintenance system antidote protein VapI